MKLVVQKAVEVPHCFEARYVVLGVGVYAVVKEQSRKGTCYRLPDLDVYLSEVHPQAKPSLTIVEDEDSGEGIEAAREKDVAPSREIARRNHVKPPGWLLDFTKPEQQSREQQKRGRGPGW